MTQKLRVYEYARNQNMSSKEVLEILKRLNINVRNHMSVMDPDMVSKVEAYMERLKQKAEPKAKASPAKKENDRKHRPSKGQGKKDGQKKPRQADTPHEKVVPSRAEMTASDEADNVPKKEKPKRKKLPKHSEDKNQRKEQRHDPQGNKSKKSKQAGKTHKPEQFVAAEKSVEKITVSGPMTVGELAKSLKKEPSEVIKKLMMLGIMATINQEVDMDAITLIAEEYGIEVEHKVEVDETQFELIEEQDDPALLKERPPVVTVMGHVDHGKTTLLDTIRHTNVTAQEAGGITQHIGAYQIDYEQKKITFLDTPGHEAFTTMRARGAQVTDIAIIVVAADDGVMPQTREAINHAQAAKVPIIVAINKMDKPEANPEKVKQELMELNLVPEEWGGDTIFVPISALKGEGLDELMEMVLLVAEMEELKANPDRLATGTVIEAELDRGKGPVATVLVQNGTLRVGDPIVVGNTYGRVRAMTNDKGRRIKEAGPSTPVEITGLQDVPQAGDQFKVFEDEKKARAIGEARAEKQKQEERAATSRVNLDELFQQIQEGDIKEINVILKADVQGSVEALKAALEKIDVEGVRVKIIHSAVGAITESDVTLAAASNAIVIGFNVRPQPQAKQLAEEEKVDIRLHRIIYNVTEEIENAMKGMLDPEYQEKVIGTVEVRQIFKVSKVGTIAGSYVKEGKITRDSMVRLIRDGVVIHEGKINALKRFKDDVREVAQGYECGITIENYNDIKEGDVIEAYVMEEIER
ncbi:translation initiation factor IF-2 [Caldalkalibacillus uzonensis]|uniref:Translation initiation factor IF-2 n=1 Tax=Caldalkalibacillus uzonensis TaxID=353224 RepID=A0ABU0CLK4_9BACI|nr:translation initiation factor IF-2 [Caldalkalibacillus uzonensis]MDQ0337304.1 translation initiation factor IF-2 [Caldalkalibacillus uzonensis]